MKKLFLLLNNCTAIDKEKQSGTVAQREDHPIEKYLIEKGMGMW